ncbi:uncharacterized protein PHACADRAFT_256486 [Phanerochaete carnosa HHB-10118-sp]|uniref:Exonuclease domain-containing protein n=1 Tax=Phanerochaete carnosa (strain HHB-10118-sp) TaxID=650164 RepID=K5UZS6_PHACS|nr:uncharacterized protein PHACADRAFT_256486 [Phanerochaete carnosa HHB-10118-sp]EKM55686.1 hypothetical protein PHACADRAFT_256486 [Phanerochaete carnosa HHB-10118-sp]
MLCPDGLSLLLFAILTFAICMTVSSRKPAPRPVSRLNPTAPKFVKASERNEATKVASTTSSSLVQEERIGCRMDTAVEDVSPTAARQAYDAFLVVDVEATCMPGTDFNYANEIIEWPVCLLRWKYKSENGQASRLEVVDEFRSFVRPMWRPQLSSFCTQLTGITQENVNAAPPFSTMVHSAFREFMVRNGLIDAYSGEPLVRFCWCSDGPWDLRDFVVKQCFISRMAVPTWLARDFIDVRRIVAQWQQRNDPNKPRQQGPTPNCAYLPMVRQLHLLGLGPFQGRQHCGQDDTRNVARIITELARQGMPLKPNTSINLHRRWSWMGRNGKVLEGHVLPAYTSL